MPGNDAVLSEIRERMVRVETKIDTMAETKETALIAARDAAEAFMSARSAHHRLNEMQDNQKWLWRTVVGGIIVGAISFLWKGIGL